MGFLNQSFAQVRDLFASMTPAARITAVLLLAVIGVSLGYLFQDYTGGRKEALLNGDTLTAGEADAMQAAIATAGLSDFERQGNLILVPRGQKAVYLAAVADGGALPANLDTLLLDEADNMGVFTDRKMTEARMKATLERMVSMIIRKMDGVADANVLYAIREGNGFTEKRSVTATVSVRPAPGEELTPMRAKNIREAVAGAEAGLLPKDVTVLNLADSSRLQDIEAVSPEAYDDKYFQTRMRYERDMKARIEDLLRYIPGVRVQVTAELDDTLEAETRAVTSTGETQTIREDTDQSLAIDSQVDDRGRPGATAQGPGRTPPEEAVAKNEHRTEANTREAESFIPTNEEVVKRSGLVPKDVRASVAIPSDYIASVWRAQNTDAAPDAQPSNTDIEGFFKLEDDKITGIVGQLLPRQPENAPYPNVKVTLYQSMTPPPVEAPTMMAETLMWASSNSGSLIMAGLAVLSLIMLRSMVKSIPSPDTNVVLSMQGAGAGAGFGAAGMAGGEFGTAAAGGPGGGLGGEFGGGARPPGEKGRPRLRLKKGPSLKEDLTDMVREDPDAAAAILRTWISSAG